MDASVILHILLVSVLCSQEVRPSQADVRMLSDEDLFILYQCSNYLHFDFVMLQLADMAVELKQYIAVQYICVIPDKVLIISHCILCLLNNKIINVKDS